LGRNEKQIVIVLEFFIHNW